MAEREKKLVITCFNFPPIVVGSPGRWPTFFGPTAARWRRLSAGSTRQGRSGLHSALQDPLPAIQAGFSAEGDEPIQAPALFHRSLVHLFSTLAAQLGSRLCRIDSRGHILRIIVPRVPEVENSLLGAHIHDLWHEGLSKGGFQEILAAEWEPVVFREADKVFCMTESAIAYYQAKYPRAYEMMPHCVPADPEIPERISVRTRKPGQEKLILYTGNISSDMNQDALAEFVKCIDFLPPEYKIQFLTSHSVEPASSRGFTTSGSSTAGSAWPSRRG